MTTNAAAKQRLDEIEREQSAFNAQLEDMILDHEGEFAVFKDGRPLSFFATYDEAYRAGLEHFGIDDVFLVSEVKRRTPQTTSIAWESGVMFSDR